MTKYTKHENDEVFIIGLDEVLRLACCACGLVHTCAFLVNNNSHYREACKQNGSKKLFKKNQIGIVMREEPRATAQLRRHKYGDLQRPIRGDKYSLKRRCG